MNPDEHKGERKSTFTIGAAREKMSSIGRKLIIPIKVKLKENKRAKKVVIVSLVVIMTSTM